MLSSFLQDIVFAFGRPFFAGFEVFVIGVIED
jgi:hypothetical protein